jgi:hypothetical protein
MRYATWQKIEASPFWHGVYRSYRSLVPASARAPLRALLTPRWHIATSLVRAASRHRVVAGPFRGMRLELSPLSRRHHMGYILGSQELELRDAIEQIIAKRYRAILNVGAADGYYAVGLALRSPHSRVIAFEALPELHPVITRTARENGVANRIAVLGTCGLDELRHHLNDTTGRTLVLMDIEGAEAKLLDPAAVTELARADILVETHDAFVPGCTETLIERFRPTHEIFRYAARPRALSDYPADFLPLLKRWFPNFAVELMHERRAGTQQWLYLVAHDAGAHPRD